MMTVNISNEKIQGLKGQNMWVSEWSRFNGQSKKLEVVGPDTITTPRIFRSQIHIFSIDKLEDSPFSSNILNFNLFQFSIAFLFF